MDKTQCVSNCRAFTNGGTLLILRCFGQFVSPLRRIKLGVDFVSISCEDACDVRENMCLLLQRFVNVKLLSKCKTVLSVK